MCNPPCFNRGTMPRSTYVFYVSAKCYPPCSNGGTRPRSTYALYISAMCYPPYSNGGTRPRSTFTYVLYISACAKRHVHIKAQGVGLPMFCTFQPCAIRHVRIEVQGLGLHVLYISAMCNLPCLNRGTRPRPTCFVHFSHVQSTMF